jgi:hypothetical protein
MQQERNYLANNEDTLDLDYQKYRSKVFNPLVPTKGHI